MPIHSCFSHHQHWCLLILYHWPLQCGITMFDPNTYIFTTYSCRLKTFHCFFCDFKTLVIAKPHHCAADRYMLLYELLQSHTLWHLYYCPFWFILMYFILFIFIYQMTNTQHSIHSNRYYNLVSVSMIKR